MLPAGEYSFYGATSVQGFIAPTQYHSSSSNNRIPQTGTTAVSPPSFLAGAMNDDKGDTMTDGLFREESGLIRQTTTANLSTSSSSSSHPSQAYQLPEDPLGRHLLMLVAVTLPWYAFTAYEMMLHTSSATTDVDFFGLSTTVVSALGLYVVGSQFGVYYGCLRLGKASTLGEAQMLVGIMTCLCIPADVIGTLYVPTGSLGITVTAFALVTTAFGVFLSHYLRKSAYREIPPMTSNSSEYFLPNGEEEQEEEGTATAMIMASEHARHAETSIWATIREYRPPPHPSSTALAMEFTRGFVSFTISVSALGTFFAEGHNPDFWIIASLLSVLVHTSIECFLATTYPGIELEEFDSYLVAESILYSIHMVATTIVSHEEGFGDTLVDQILWSWLFGSATGKLIDRLGKLLGKVDFDAKMGLSKFV